MYVSSEFDVLQDVGLPDETCNNYAAKTTPMCDAEAMCMNCMVVDRDGTEECWPVTGYTK